ncbi:hypothetical protein [Streptomyces sp. AS02]|uniref:hypothetical protein n=1 Tax=Streptomyces sp. AS02 TaxID=2938946 RepID=UPI0020204555|nr:hypothetical protein [Streptomyces sp. AS02]MCL8016568.1 hypothetical protein [Streptomyces sp. AS02]
MNTPTSPDDRCDEPDQLRDQVRQLLRYRAVIALGIVLGLLGGLALVLFGAGTYTATAEVRIRSTADPINAFGVTIDNQVTMGTERRIALSDTVAARAAKALGEPSRADALPADLRVASPPDSQVLRFEYTAGSAKRAARVTDAFAAAYLADREARIHAMVKRLTGGLEQQIAVLAKRKTPKGDEAAAAGLRDQTSALHKRISDIRTYDTTAGEVVRGAEPPDRPSGPGPAALIGFGLVGGLVLGTFLAWLCAALEPRARSIGDVRGALGAPVLGLLPPSDPDGELVQVGRGGGSLAEAYRALAFRLRHDENLMAKGTLLVVAPKQDRAAEAAAVNLAAAFAESGEDVLLVDATADSPGLSARLPAVAGGPDAGTGTAGTAETAGTAGSPEGRIVVDAGTAGRFTLFPDRRGGTTTDDALAPSAVTRALPDTDSGRSALVVTRPLLEHTDGLAVAQRVDGVLVVGGLDRTRRDDLKRVRDLISCSGGHLVGAVLDTGTPRSRLRHALDAVQARRPAELLRRFTASAAPAAGAGDRPAPPRQADGGPREEKLAPSRQDASAQDDTLTASR